MCFWVVMRPLRRLFGLRCGLTNCPEEVVATFTTGDRCLTHLEDIAESKPTAVWDWKRLPDYEFDVPQLAAALDAAVCAQGAWSIVEEVEDRSCVLAGALSVERNHTATRADQRWLHWIATDPTEPNTVGQAILSRSTHRLPIGLLEEVLELLVHPRSVAFVSDVLWCATGTRQHALTAINAHLLCATDDTIATEHRASGTPIMNEDPDAHERHLNLRTWRFQLAHLERGMELAQTFNEQVGIAAFRERALRLLGVVDHTEREVVDLLEAVAPRLNDAPSWWDQAAEDETIRLEKLPNAPVTSLDRLFALRIARARAQKQTEMVGDLHRRHIRAYWHAAEITEAHSYMRSEWLRQACELAQKHAPDLLAEARSRHGAIDPTTDLTPASAEMPQELIDQEQQLAVIAVKHVAELTAFAETLESTAQRLMFVAAETVDLFKRIYETSDQYVNTPVNNMFTTITYGPNERIAVTEEQRVAHARKGQVWRHLQRELRLVAGPVAARILELFDPHEPWPTDSFELFDDTARTRLYRALELACADDFDTAVHLLAPLVERVVKRLAEASGARPVIPASSDGGRSNTGTLGTLLQTLAETTTLPAPLVAGLLFVTTADVMALSLPNGTALPAIEGLNLRNDVAHGTSTGTYNYAHFLLLLLCVGALGAITNTPDDRTGRPESPTAA
jgi:hypothetical protein